MHWRGEGGRGLLVPSSPLPPPRERSALQGRDDDDVDDDDDADDDDGGDDDDYDDDDADDHDDSYDDDDDDDADDDEDDDADTDDDGNVYGHVGSRCRELVHDFTDKLLLCPPT